MPDNEEILPLLANDVVASEPQAFRPEQMLRCETCLRANPPTRTNCLYCAAPLPVPEGAESLQRLTVRPLEKWEQGYNCVLAGDADVAVDPQSLEEAGRFLNLPADTLKSIVTKKMALPLARTGSSEEASLARERLHKIGIEVVVISDNELSIDSQPIRIGAAQIEEERLTLYTMGRNEQFDLNWSQIFLIVVGRVVIKQVEINEKAQRAERKVIDASEFYADESVVDIYVHDDPIGYRINSNSFDFSCLGSQKKLIANENFQTFVDIVRQRSVKAEYNDSYNSVRSALEAVWPSEAHRASLGWRRKGAGRYSTGAVTETSNETQFRRYSRLRCFLKTSRPVTPNANPQSSPEPAPQV